LGLTVTADNTGIPSDLDVAAMFGAKLTHDDLFNLTVYNAGVQVEKFLNLSLVDGPRRIDRVLAQQSQYLVANVSTTISSGLGQQIAIVIASNGGTVVNKVPQGLGFRGGQDSAPLDNLSYDGDGATTGIYALQRTDLFNLLCIPPDSRPGGDTAPAVLVTAMQYAQQRRAVLIVDPPSAWASAADAQNGLTDLGLTGPNARNAAIYFPRVIKADPLRQGQTDAFPPCGVVAGLIAATDAQRGVWKAPAGVDVALQGIQGLATRLTDSDSGTLNPLGVNCLRTFPATGSVIWGARTLRGSDQLADDYKYLSVRRLALYIEESLVRGLQWVLFEPNDTPLWAQIRANVGAFMNNLFRKGAFQGASSKDAYFVKCDSETTTQNDINLGVVNVVVGFAPLKPAEFVVISIQQLAGQIAA
jgi:phage tail sheath protein FI